MNQINFGGESGEEKGFLRRGIAATDDADRHVLVECAVARRAGSQAMTDQFLFILQSEIARRRATGDDERLRFEPFVVRLDANVAVARSNSVSSA